MRRFRVNPTVQVTEPSGLLTREGYNLFQSFVSLYAADAPLSGGTTTTIAHGLGTSDVSVSVRVKASGLMESPTVTVLDDNTVQVEWPASVAAASRRVVVIG